MPRLRVEGCELDYEASGRGGSALLLLTGWCASREAFRPLVPLLSSKHRVVALDWRGHGRSGAASADFGLNEQVDDAAAVMAAEGAPPFIPVATAHAGWVAIELRRRLGPARVPALVLLDWIVSEGPPPFMEGLKALQTADHWREARDGLFGMWLHGVTDPTIARFVGEDMGSYGREMWARAAREISGAYAREGSPLKALEALAPPPPTLHAFAQPPDPAYLAMQQAFAAEHPWFRVRKLSAASHFPTLEVPSAVAAEIDAFVRGLSL